MMDAGCQDWGSGLSGAQASLLLTPPQLRWAVSAEVGLPPMALTRQRQQTAPRDPKDLPPTPDHPTTSSCSLLSKITPKLIPSSRGAPARLQQSPPLAAACCPPAEGPSQLSP